MRTLTIAAALCSAIIANAGQDRTPADGLCEWRTPGADKYMLPLPDAVDRLDLPGDLPKKLKARLDDPRKAINADDHILVTRDGVEGEKGSYVLRHMNGGQGGVCWGEVTRKTWTPMHAERALVFCEDGVCLAYFSVCRNIAVATLTTPRRTSLTVPGGSAADPAPDAPPEMTFAALAIPQESPSDPPKEPPAESFDSAFGGWPDVPPVPVGFGIARVPGGSGGYIPGPVPGVVPPDALPSELPDTIVEPVPEPETVALMALGLGLMMWRVSRSRAQMC